MTVTRLPSDVIAHASIGDAQLHLTMTPEGRLVPLITCTTTLGRVVALDITAQEVANLARDLLAVCHADRDQLTLWRTELDCAET